KRSNKVVEKLGTYDDIKKKIGDMDPYEWGRARAKKLTLDKNLEKEGSVSLSFSPQVKIELNSRSSFNCGYLFLQQVYYSLGLRDICKSISNNYSFEYDLNDIVSRLIFSRMLSPSSKRSSFEFFSSFLEPSSSKLHDVYRALDVIFENSDFIQSELYSNSLNVIDRNTSVLYFDCTNFFFEIEQDDDFRKYGFSKEHRPNPIVQMGLFMDGDGIPLAFSVNPGNQNEQLSLKPIEKRIIDDFALSRFVVCTDAGLSSIANRKFNNFSSRYFVTTQSVRKLKGFLKEWALDPNGWRVYGDDRLFNISELDPDSFMDCTFFKERWINDDGIEQKLFITFSFKYQRYKRSLREKDVNRASNLVEKSKSLISRKNQNDIRRFIKTTNVTKDGEVCDKTFYKIDQSVIDKEAMYDGFYGVCTNLESNAKEIIAINHRRWEIEESFRIMKSEFKARPVYLSKEGRIKAHFMICFLSLLILRIIEKRLKYEFTVNEILKCLSEMTMFRKKDLYIPTYTRTNLTDALHEEFGFNTDMEVITAQKLRKIIRKTK
ncbi:MAG: transposase, partial [Anaerococcus sp.]|nr:transposase [Anaerococcus sp.]